MTAFMKSFRAAAASDSFRSRIGIGLLVFLLATCVGLGAPNPAMRVERNVWVPMRDGIRLVANVFRPVESGSYPVLVMRTPYGRQGDGKAAAYVEAGYIVVLQEDRLL
jgi:predicted acyl esterase